MQKSSNLSHNLLTNNIALHSVLPTGQMQEQTTLASLYPVTYEAI